MSCGVRIKILPTITYKSKMVKKGVLKAFENPYIIWEEEKFAFWLTFDFDILIMDAVMYVKRIQTMSINKRRNWEIEREKKRNYRTGRTNRKHKTFRRININKSGPSLAPRGNRESSFDRKTKIIWEARVSRCGLLRKESFSLCILILIWFVESESRGGLCFLIESRVERDTWCMWGHRTLQCSPRPAQQGSSKMILVPKTIAGGDQAF